MYVCMCVCVSRCLDYDENNVVALARLMNIKMQANQPEEAERVIEKVGKDREGLYVCRICMSSGNCIHLCNVSAYIHLSHSYLPTGEAS